MGGLSPSALLWTVGLHEALVQPAAIGTLFLLPVGGDDTREPFDLVDLSDAQTLVIRMDDFALCAVFDDACAVLHGLDR